MSEKRFNKSRGRRLAAGIFKGFLVCLVGAFIFTAAACGLQEVTINGNYHESEEEVLRLLGRGPFAHNTVFLYLFNRGRKVSGNTFVDTLTVDLDTRNSITVNVNEKKLIGYVEYDDRYWYFNRAGVILVSTEKNTDPSAGNDIAESVGEDPAAAAAEVPADEGGDETAAQPELLMTGIENPFELNGMIKIPGVRTVLLAADEVIYGEEVIADEEVTVSEDVTGASENAEGEEVYEPEYDSGEMYDAEAEEYTEPYKEEYADAEEAYEDTDPSEEGAEEYSEETEYSEDGQDEEMPSDDIIIPSVEEGGPDIGNDVTGSETNEAQTWDIDTSAKGGNYLPLVEGLTFSEAVVGYPLPVQFDRVFSSIAVLKSYVDRSGYVPDMVSYTKNGNLIVTYKSAAINLGNGESIEQRVSVMGDALPSFVGLSGTLHLENYDGTQKRLIFSKN